VVSFKTPVAAQDEGLNPLRPDGNAGAGVTSNAEAQGFQLYRLPFSFRVRKPHAQSWGLRVTFPLSFTLLRVEDASSIGGLLRKFAVAAVVPGLELEVPVGRRMLVRPFGELGIGKTSGESSTQMMYGAGLRIRTFQDVKGLHLTYGGSVAGRKRPVLARTYDRYGSLEAGVDVQIPLGFSVQRKAARGGMYAIGRAFNGLELQRDGQPPIVLRRQLEAGVSFSTEPDLRVWKIRLPWLAVGYQFGDTVSGVRVYARFPF